MRAFYLRLMGGLSVSVLKVLAGILVAGEELNLTTRCSGDLHYCKDNTGCTLGIYFITT
jgi:hypothetical protein